MTEMTFYTCQRVGGYVWCSRSVVRRKVANYFFRSKHPTIPQLFWNTLYSHTTTVHFYVLEENIKNLMDNLDFFKWHDNQKVDESKRVGQSQNKKSFFSLTGSFKKLELD
jgi:hypothetical protein